MRFVSVGSRRQWTISILHLSVFTAYLRQCEHGSLSQTSDFRIGGNVAWEFERAGAPLYFSSWGHCKRLYPHLHAAQCTSPVHASVLNQRPTKMGYTRPCRRETIDLSCVRGSIPVIIGRAINKDQRVTRFCDLQLSITNKYFLKKWKKKWKIF